MPDLTPIAQWQCETAEAFETTIRGKTGDYTIRFDRTSHQSHHYEYDWSCSCASYQYQRGVDRRGHCKHVRSVIADEKRCGWSQLVHGGEPLVLDGKPTCPKCGGGVVTREHMV